MARTYKFVMHCWQDQYGDENAKANIFVNGTQVATDVEITATSVDSLQRVTFEATGLPAPNWNKSVTAEVKVVLTNEAFVDVDNDRNIWINGLFAFSKEPDDSDYLWASADPADSDWDTVKRTLTDDSIADDTAIKTSLSTLPTDVQGSQIDSSWWTDDALASNGGAGTWYHIPVWGDAADTGTTITIPLAMGR